MNSKNSERGFVLMVVYIVAALVSVFSIAFFARHHVNMQSAERYQNRIRAFNAAEAGIDAALHELTVASRQAETAAAAYTSPETVLTQSAFHYTISPVQGQPLRRRIDARGCSPSCTSTSRGYQDADITVYCQIASAAVSSNLFSYGVYTTGNMILDKFRFDSYNSTSAYGGSNISDAGAIATNSTAIGAITMTNATVNGSAMVSENGNNRSPASPKPIRPSPEQRENCRRDGRWRRLRRSQNSRNLLLSWEVTGEAHCPRGPTTPPRSRFQGKGLLSRPVPSRYMSTAA